MLRTRQERRRGPKNFDKLSFVRFPHLLSLEIFGQVVPIPRTNEVSDGGIENGATGATQ